jgi:hypothetical protein
MTRLQEKYRGFGSLAAGRALLLGIVLALSGCGGGGGSGPDGGGPGPSQPINQPPTADAGTDQTVAQGSAVILSGTGADPEGGSLSFSWEQTGGVPVDLADADSETPRFTAPPVAAGATEVLVFELTVSDGDQSANDSITVTVQEAGTTVTVSGRVSYEFVPARTNPQCGGLDFGAVVSRPIRQATVQLLDAGNQVVASTTSDDSGEYAFAGVPANIQARLRVRAELKSGGSASWDVEVRDYFDDSASPPPLGSRPLYVVDGALFDTGGVGSVRNLTAPTGWGGSGYTGDRAAAPFAILDAIYTGMKLVLSVDPNADFPPLDAFWSVNNTSLDGDVALGEIGTSYYTGNPVNDVFSPSLFLLGDAADDTEEFDSHVVIHEWGHYFEDTFSRSDSIGGAHALGQSLDARLAFGEGFATALAAMALGEPLYCDTGAPGTQQGFGISAETSNPGLQGWFNEVSVVTLLFDLFDTTDEGNGDTGSIGFAPIYETLRGPQRETPAFTSVFSFATELRPMLDGAGQALLDALLEREAVGIGAALDIWGGTTDNDANGGQDVLPLYTDVAGDGSVLNLCVNNSFDTFDPPTGNKLAEQRYLRFRPQVSGLYDISVVTTTALPPPETSDYDPTQSDPDVWIYESGVLVGYGISSVQNREVLSEHESFRDGTGPIELTAGSAYVIEVEEWRYDDPDADFGSYPPRICFDVTLTAN